MSASACAGLQIRKRPLGVGWSARERARESANHARDSCAGEPRKDFVPIDEEELWREVHSESTASRSRSGVTTVPSPYFSNPTRFRFLGDGAGPEGGTEYGHEATPLGRGKEHAGAQRRDDVDVRPRPRDDPRGGAIWQTSSLWICCVVAGQSGARSWELRPGPNRVRSHARDARTEVRARARRGKEALRDLGATLTPSPRSPGSCCLGAPLVGDSRLSAAAERSRDRLEV